MFYIFSEEDKEKIIKRFGSEFFTNVNGLLGSLTLRWDIYELKLINSFSANLVFKGKSNIHGLIVMKFVSTYEEFIYEANSLKYFNGCGTCKLIDVDFDNKVLLEEFIYPGEQLVLEKGIEKRLDVFCYLYHQLHKVNHKQLDMLDDINTELNYKTYKDWIFRITNYMEQEKSWKEITLHMKRAKQLYIELSEEFTSVSLLHGDLHYYNILKGINGYKIIDPKGVIGNPIFDIPRYILNEFWDEGDKNKVDEKIEKVFKILSDRLNLSRLTLSKLLYIEGTMAICWCIEDGANIEDKANFLHTLGKFYEYLK